MTKGVNQTKVDLELFLVGGAFKFSDFVTGHVGGLYSGCLIVFSTYLETSNLDCFFQCETRPYLK